LFESLHPRGDVFRLISISWEIALISDDDNPLRNPPVQV
jgi:hypothetical protein